MIKRILVSFLFLFATIFVPSKGLFSDMLYSAHAQYYGSNNKKAVKYYENAVSYMSQGDVAKALEYFNSALEADPKFVEIYLIVADIYMRSEQYDEAIDYYEAFLEHDTKHPHWKETARKNIAIAEFRLRSFVNPVSFEPVNLGTNINSRDDEYLPGLTVDGNTLIFTRRFPANENTIHHSPQEEDFYVSHFVNGAWTLAERMSEPVNSHDNEGAQCISQDGRIMFFTACGRRDGAGRCDLFMCTRKGNKWSKPRNLGPVINTPSWESQPSFSIDGKTLYFVSDRPGGYGGMDIYKAVFADGKWRKPENLGPEINTEGNEISPFIHYNDHTLYFASDGHVGMGGLDLFVSEKDTNGKWGKPRNLGYPINTIGDESGLIVTADGKTAIYSSDALGGIGKQDLYTFQLPEESQASQVTYQHGIVYDKETEERLGATVEVIDIATGNEVASTSSDATDGSFTVSLPSNATYALHVNAKGYLFYSENFDLRYGVGETPPTLMVPLSPIQIGEEITLRNIFFETAKYELLPTSRAELAKLIDLMKKNPSIHIMLGGHTDNVGGADYNMELSENRAKAVAEYLKGHGISAGRISYKGYGATKPVAENSTEEGRALNRRTTLEIISF